MSVCVCVPCLFTWHIQYIWLNAAIFQSMQMFITHFNEFIQWRLYHHHHPTNEKLFNRLHRESLPMEYIKIKTKNQIPHAHARTHSNTHINKPKQVYNRNIIRSFTFCLYFLSSHNFFCVRVLPMRWLYSSSSSSCCCFIIISFAVWVWVCVCLVCVHTHCV